MNLKFKIEAQKTNAFVSRELKKRITTVKIVFGIVLMALFTVAVATKAYILFPIALVGFSLVFLYVTSMFKGDLKTLANAYRFEINETSISRLVHWNEFSAMQKIRAERANTRYGENLNQTIAIQDIHAVTIQENEIEIRSINANPINGNGIIVIPQEIENYTLIMDFFKSNPEKFKIT